MNASKSKSSEGLILLNDHQVNILLIFLIVYFLYTNYCIVKSLLRYCYI